MEDRFRICLSRSVVTVFDSHESHPREFDEERAARRLVTYDELVRALEQILEGADATHVLPGAGLTLREWERRLAYARSVIQYADH